MIAEKQGIEVRLLGNSINLISVQAKLHKSHEATLAHDVLCVLFDQRPAFIFSYGVIVTWGIKAEFKMQLLDKVQVATNKKVTENYSKSYQFEVADDNQIIASVDKFWIQDDSVTTKMALSYALAQSACLGSAEGLADAIISEHQHLEQTLVSTGKMSLNRIQTGKLRGRLFKAKHEILLRYNVLKTPKCFMEYPDHEITYRRYTTYLDLQPRVKLLSFKLQIIQGLLDMLASEQYHNHYFFLKWTIMFLIFVNIVIYFGH